jgi:protein gp37
MGWRGYLHPNETTNNSMALTAIEWTHRRLEVIVKAIPGFSITKQEYIPGYSFNGWLGCTEVSPECAECYAKALIQDRYKKAYWGDNHARVKTKDWTGPRLWNKRAKETKTSPYVFSFSLADVFDAKAPEEWREEFFDLVEKCDQLEWLILTKRHDNMLKWAKTNKRLKNVRLGVSCGIQQSVKKLNALIETGYPNFVSMEPLIGPLEIAPEVWQRLDWVIVGGESKQTKRTPRVTTMDWVDDVYSMANRFRVPFFFKQWGHWLPVDSHSVAVKIGLEAGGKMVDGKFYSPVGKYKSWRTYRGKEWNEQPEQLWKPEAELNLI